VASDRPRPTDLRDFWRHAALSNLELPRQGLSPRFFAIAGVVD
jgi:hypothetical protein